MPPKLYLGTDVSAAGQTIIEDRYKRMAAVRKTFRLFNNLAVAFTIAFLSIHLRAEGGSAGGDKLNPNEMLLGAGETFAWFFFFMGLGYGRAQREAEWVLRLAMLMSSAALMAHILNMNPERLKGVGEILEAEGEPGQTFQLMGVLAQVAAMGCRIVVINSAAGYLKDKKETRPSRTTKKTK